MIGRTGDHVPVERLLNPPHPAYRNNFGADKTAIIDNILLKMTVANGTVMHHHHHHHHQSSLLLLLLCTDYSDDARCESEKFIRMLIC